MTNACILMCSSVPRSKGRDIDAVASECDTVLLAKGGQPAMDEVQLPASPHSSNSSRAEVNLQHQQGGKGEPILVLLHGLGATGEVWSAVRETVRERWPGRWLIPDLRGHGGSPHVRPYTFGQHAADVAALLERWGPTVVVGHSMGGVVALALASGWFGVPVVGVVGLGLKVVWTDEELARVGELSSRPVRWFDDYAAAAARYLRVAGLDGLAEPDSPLARSGVTETGGRFRLAADPLAAEIGPPDMRGMLTAARAPVILACGSEDQLVSVQQLRELVDAPVELPGLAHNAHVQDPECVWQLISKFRTPTHGGGDD
jgi:pimeloyl-ACP methyl ester carboxylesterase